MRMRRETESFSQYFLDNMNFSQKNVSILLYFQNPPYVFSNVDFIFFVCHPNT